MESEASRYATTVPMGSVALMLRQAFWRISSLMMFARILRIADHSSERAKPLKPHITAIAIFDEHVVIDMLASPERKVPVIIILKGEILSPRKPLII